LAYSLIAPVSGFAFTIPAPLTRNILSGSKLALDIISTHNAGFTLGAGHVSKSSLVYYIS